MDFELKALTEPGARLIALAETHALDFATRAERHDRENSFVAENFDALKASGFLAGCALAEHGGLEVRSLHDLTVALSRLARGCASTALATTMHMVSVWLVVRWHLYAVKTNDTATVQSGAMLLPMLGRSQLVICGAGSESGSVALAPTLRADPAPGGGYVLNGRKIFVTGCEAANLISVLARVPAPDGSLRLGLASVFKGTPGMTIEPTWDALGMRGSGSHDVVFSDCRVPESWVMLEGPLGEWPRPSYLMTNFPLLGTSLGIAEAARQHLHGITSKPCKEPLPGSVAERPAVQHRVGEIEVALCAARGALSRTAREIDAALARDDHELRRAQVDALMREFQCAKLIVNRAACEVVDQALTISGGSGYLSRSPLSRLYRDVRAGPFMQPFSPLEAYEHIGRSSLGLDPRAELADALAGQSPTTSVV